MGKANKTRRAAKRRQRERTRRRHDQYDDPWQPPPRPRHQANHDDPPFDDEAMLHAAARAFADGDLSWSGLIDCLAGRPPQPVARALQGVVERAVASIWNAGWRPADLDWAARKAGNSMARRFLAAAVVEESRSYEGIGAEAAPDWMTQVAALGSRLPAGSEPWPLRWAKSVGVSWPDAISAGVDALSFLRSLAPIPEVEAPPKAWGRGVPRQRDTNGIDTKLLARIRALLAKAESSEFEEEASAFTAKAQELMTRHRIDRLLVADESGAAEEVIARRIATDDPYARAKAMLLGGVSVANGCRSIWSERYGFGTVYGRASDLQGVDLLFTSLLVQATTAMRAAGRDRRTRSRSFRQSFLVGFAQRVTHRLLEGVEAATEAAVADESCDGSLLPVLARSDAEVEDAMKAANPRMGTFSVGVNDRAGYAAGVMAGDLAELTAPRPEIDDRKAS